MNSTEPLSFMSFQLNKAQMRRTHSLCEQQQPSLLSWIDLGPSHTTSLLDRVQHPEEIEIQPLFMRISTLSSKTVVEGESQNHQQPRRYLSPWNGSPASPTVLERRRSSPTLWRLIPSNVNSPKTLSLLEQMLMTPAQTMKWKAIPGGEETFPLHKKRLTAATSFSKDQPHSEILTTNMSLDQKDNDWHSQTCLGMEHNKEGDLSPSSSVVAELASSLNCMERTLHEASFSSEPPDTPPKEFRHPNGSGSFKESHSTSTISSLQLSALKLMKTGRLALEKHISHLAQARPRGKLRTQQTGRLHGDMCQKPLLSHSLTVGKNLTFINDTFKSSSTQNNPTSTNESFPMTLQSETMWEVDRQHYSPINTTSPTCIPPLSCQTASNTPLHQLLSEKQCLPERPSPQKYATSSTLTQVAPTTPVGTGMCAKNAE